ncbi:MAG: LacI family transcriptional regulator [Candidatus Omnitrophica bacterium]|nr:LacI family transcriptional regulator [Candidatus Omnitrophota bacterium]
MRIAEIKKEPVWKKIYNTLSLEISKYEFGENFYTAEDICKKYNVSTITAIRVLSELEREGLVQKIKKKGTIVKNIKQKIDIKLILPEGALLHKILSNPRSMEIYSGITSKVEKLGFTFATIYEKYLLQIFSKFPDHTGFVMLTELSPFIKGFLKEKKGIPFVLLNPPAYEKNCISIRVDRKKSTYLLVNYFISIGHTRIGFINGPATSLWFLPRLEGYIQALQENGIEYDTALVKETDGDATSEDEENLEELLSLASPPTAIITASDHRAINLLNYCHRKNIKIPDELSIAGDDNSHEGLLVHPSLTTVERNMKKIGEKAVECLIMLINGKNIPRDIVVQPELVIRESTKERR